MQTKLIPSSSEVRSVRSELSTWRDATEPQLATFPAASERHTGSHDGAGFLISESGAEWLNRLNQRMRDRQAGTAPITTLPHSLLSLILSFTSQRFVCAVATLISQPFRKASRDRSLWNSFHLNRLLATSELPLPSRFVVVQNLFSSERELREHFWMTKLAEGKRFVDVPTISFSGGLLYSRIIRKVFTTQRKVRQLDLSLTKALDDDVLRTITSMMGSEGGDAQCAPSSSSSAAAVVVPPVGKGTAKLVQVTSPALVEGVPARRQSEIPLEVVSLRFCVEFSAAPLVEFAQAVSATLTDMDVTGCDQLPANTFALLLKALPNLRVLRAQSTLFSSESFLDTDKTSLIPPCPALEELSVGFGRLCTGDALFCIRRVCPMLQRLSFQGNKVTNEEFVAFLNNRTSSEAEIDPALRTMLLHELDISNTEVTDEGLLLLVERCPWLVSLNVNTTNITGAGIRHALNCLSRLRVLHACCLGIQKSMLRDRDLPSFLRAHKDVLTAQTMNYLQLHQRR